MRIIMKHSILIPVLLLTAMAIFSGCSRDTVGYDELEAQGKTEAAVRKRYSDFFNALTRLASADEPDSLLLDRLYKATDDVVHGLNEFPGTVDSRLSLDALSYGAGIIVNSPVFRKPVVWNYWRIGLIEPILIKSRAYVKSDRHNESSQVQLVKAIQRGAGSRVTDDLLLELIPLVGPAPSESLFAICEADTLALRRIHDLLLYTRSLQEMGPPLWMVTGDWLMAVEIDGWPLSFYGFRPKMINNTLYAIFREFSPGTVYEKVYKDSLPADYTEQNAWLKRAAERLENLVFDRDFAIRVQSSGLPMYDAHNIYNDYMIAAEGDSINKCFNLFIKLQPLTISAFEYTGLDSLGVVFELEHIIEPGIPVTRLNAHRYKGGSMTNGRYTSAQSGRGYAYLMPLGRHNPAILQALIDANMPVIEVNSSPPG